MYSQYLLDKLTRSPKQRQQKKRILVYIQRFYVFHCMPVILSFLLILSLILSS